MTPEVKDLIDQAQWALKLLSKNAQPYNHEYTCVVRLTRAIGKSKAMEIELATEIIFCICFK